MKATIKQIKSIVSKIGNEYPILVAGQPGVGKTFMFEQIALARKAGFKVFLAGTMDNTDVAGVPFPLDGKTTFLPPMDMFALTSEAEYTGPMVACFDDIGAAPEPVFAALFNFFQRRMVGNFPVRPNVLLCATTNRVEDKAGARDLPTALNNRLLHFDMLFNEQEWRNWAINNGIEPMILGFCGKRPDLLNTFDPSKPDRAFATPRSVHMASSVQSAITEGQDVREFVDNNDLFVAIAGAVGEGWAYEYLAFIKNSELLVAPSEIFAKPLEARIPKEDEIDVAYATISSLVHALKQTEDKDNCFDRIRATFKYALRLTQKEMRVRLSQDIYNAVVMESNDGEFSSKVIMSEEWQPLSEEVTKYLV